MKMEAVLRLLAHELGAYMEMWFVLRGAYGKFDNVHNWPPHAVAKDKRVTHRFTTSVLECPALEHGKKSLSFLKLYQLHGGTQQSDGTSGDKLVGVVIRSVGRPVPAIGWWLSHENAIDAMSTSFRRNENRYDLLPFQEVEAERSKNRLNWQNGTVEFS